MVPAATAALASFGLLLGEQDAVPLMDVDEFLKGELPILLDCPWTGPRVIFLDP